MVPATTGAARLSSRHGASGLTTAPRSCSDARSGGCWTPETKREFELLLRRSGGGAVLTGPWLLGVSVALPCGHGYAGDNPTTGYRWLGTTLAELLREAGAAAEALPPDELTRSEAPTADWACFASFAPWEVASAGRKIAGLAQARSRNGVLLAAGLLLRPAPWASLCAALGRPESDAIFLSRRTISLAEAARRQVCLRNVERDLTRALHASLCGERTPRPRAAGVEAG